MRCREREIWSKNKRKIKIQNGNILLRILSINMKED